MKFNSLLLALLCLLSALRLALVAQAQSCASPPTGQVAWWMAENNANDIVGSNNGTVRNGATFASGKVGQAFSFDGVDDYILVPYNGSFNFAPGGQFTIEAWVRLQADNRYKAILVKSPPGGAWDWGLWCDNTNRFVAGHHNERAAASTTVAQSGVWYHVAVTYQNGNWNMYVNGALESQSSGIFITQSSGALAIGRKGEEPTTLGEPGYFQGLVDEPSLYNRALSATEIQEIFTADSAGKCASQQSPLLSVSDATVTEGDSSTTTLAFAVNMSTASTQSVTVQYETLSGSAAAPADYTAIAATTLTFAPGETSKTINVTVQNDTLDEFDETLQLSFFNPTNAFIADNSAVGTILDDDLSPSLSLADVSQYEGNSGSSDFVFALTLSAPSGRAISVNYATSDGTATQPADYTARSGTVTFAAGATSQSISVPVNGDTTKEANETFLLTLSALVNATVSDAEATGTIRTDDLPLLSVVGSSVTELNSGQNSVTFTVTLSEASTDPVSFDFVTAPGTATAGADYVTTSGSHTILPGETSKTINVNVNGDLIDEANETFYLVLSNPVNAFIASALPRDPNTGHAYELVTASLTWDNARTAAAARKYLGSVGHLATITGSAEQSVITNAFGTGVAAWLGGIQPSGSPEPSGGFTWITGEPFTYAHWHNGEPNNVNGIEDAIEFTGGLWNDIPRGDIRNRYLVEYDTAVELGQPATIIDNEAPPTISINDVTVTEGNSGIINAAFTITLSAASGQAVTVSAIPYNGSARSPGDYTSGGANLSFAPGETSKTFSVPVAGDLLDEINETFFVILSSSTNAAIGRGRGVGTINDDDAAPSMLIEDVAIGEGNAGQRTAVFRLRLSSPSGQAVYVNYATANGTANPATAGNDYNPVSSTQIAFNVGQTVTLARVLINGDLLNEPNETFLVNLSNPVNATISDNQAVGTILNDDSAPALNINDVSIAEGNPAQGAPGTKLLTFTVSLSKASGQTVSVNYATADGIARSTSDYVAKSGSLSFAPGSALARTISVTINGDTAVEGNETLFVLLSGAVNASVSKARGIGTITNDDTSG